MSHVKALIADNNRQYAELKRLRSLLDRAKEYAVHDGGCASLLKFVESRQCTCGLSDLLREIEKEKGT